MRKALPKRIQTKAKSSAKTSPKQKGKAVVSNAVKLDAKNPIPLEHGGITYQFLSQSAYLSFLPPKDCFAKDLLEARLLSTTHNACVVTKKDYCAGEGFQDKDDKQIDQSILDWFVSMNLNNENIIKINKKIFEDFFTYGNVPIEIVRFTVAGKKRMFIYVHSFLEWRLCEPEDDGIVREAMQSKLFLRKNEVFIKPDQLKDARTLPLFSPFKSEKENWLVDDKGVERTLIWYLNSVTGFQYYGIPSSVSSMIFQILEYKGARYNLDNFDNNMVVAAILALKGQLSQEEANKIGRNIIDTHTGDGKRGRTVVVASEEGIDGSDFHKMDTKTDGSYTEADDKWTQKIILANQWDSVLAGLVSPSTLGKGSGFITKIHELKLKTVIKPAQQDLFDSVWVFIFKMAEEFLGLKFSQYKLEFKNAIDISGLTDVDITPAVTRNEVREAKGLPKVAGKEGDEYMKPTTSNSQNSKEGDGV